MNRYQLLAAEIFSFSLVNYQDHLGLGNVRYDQVLPERARLLERADNEGWNLDCLARALGVSPDEAGASLAALRKAREVIDAPNPAAAFRAGVYRSIERAVAQGLGNADSIRLLVDQVCSRVADLALLLELEGTTLSRYTSQLRVPSAGALGSGLPQGFQ